MEILDTIDAGNTTANDSMWSNLLGDLGRSATERIKQEINPPPKPDVSPVPNTAIVQVPAMGFAVDKSTLMLAALVIGGFLLYRHFGK